MEKKEKQPRGYYVEKGSFFAHAAVTVLVLSVAARLLGTISFWSGDMMQLLVQVLLPIGCALLFIVFILLLGRLALWTTILPVLGGAAFFILSVLDGGLGWPLFVCIALAFLAAFLYTAILVGMIRSKWLITIVFLLIFAYQIFRAVPAFSDMNAPLSFVDGMTRISSIGFVLAMFCASLAFRKKKAVKAEPELPGIEDPVVLPPEENPDTDSAAKPAGTESASDPAEAAPGESQQIPDLAAFDEALADVEREELSAPKTEESNAEQ